MPQPGSIGVPTSIGPLTLRVTGSGQPVLAVHGLLVDGRLWDAVADQLRDTAMLLAADLPLGAHRRGVPDRRTLTPASLAAALVEVLDDCGIDRAVLVGNDAGGAIAQVAAGSFPDRFCGLVLTSCDAFRHCPATLLRPLQPLVRVPGVLRVLAWAFAQPALFAAPGPLNLLCARPVAKELVADWLAPARSDPAIRADLAAFFRAMRPRVTLEAAEALRGYQGSAIVAWSRRDRLFPRSDGERLAAVIPGAHLRWIDDALTFSPLDQPRAVADAIRTVLAELAR